MANKHEIVTIDLSHSEPPKFMEPRGGEGLIKYGEDNLYPDYLIKLYKSSVKHNSIINHKVRYTSSKGFAVKKLGKSLTQITSFNYLINHKNSVGDSLNRIGSKISLDFEIFNGFAFEVIWKKNGKSIDGIFHVNFGLIRAFIEKGVVRYCYLTDWTNVNTIDQARSKGKERGYKEWDSFGTNSKGSELMYYRECRPVESGESDVYPIPYYIGAIPYIQCDIDVASYCMNGIQNEFWGSQMITFTNGAPETPELKQQIEQKFNKRHTGTKNARRVVLNFVNDEKQKPIVDKLTQENIGEQFDSLNNQIGEEIFTAHSFDPILLGIGSGGEAIIAPKQDKMDAYDWFDATWTSCRQIVIEDAFNAIFNSQGMKPELYLQKVKPYGVTFSESVLKEILSAEDLKQMVYDQVGITPKADKIAVTYAAVESDLDILSRLEKEGSDVNESEILFTHKVVTNMMGVPELSDNEYKNLYLAKIFDVEFNDLQANIISIINDQPDILPEKIAEALGVKLSDVTKELNKLVDLKVLKGRIGKALEITKKGQKYVKEQDLPLKVSVRYTYSDDGAPPLVEGGKSRPFCVRLMAMARAGKTWTRQQIDAMNNGQGDSAWIYRGGFYHNPEDGENTPFCRHHWKSVIIKERG